MPPSIYDVCVIGSGPAGGVLSKELAEVGAKVALVEAGRKMTVDDYHFHAWPYELPKRKKPTPYYPPEVTQAIRYENCDNILVDRIRAVGGRSIHWNAVCLRFAERDFRERSAHHRRPALPIGPPGARLPHRAGTPGIRSAWSETSITPGASSVSSSAVTWSLPPCAFLRSSAICGLLPDPLTSCERTIPT